MHGLILAISIWAPYAVDVSKPGLRDRFNLLKGTDFLHFYTLGSLAILGRGSDLYDTVAQAALARQLVPGVEGVYFVALYGPQVSLFFASLAIVPYAWALIAWWLLTTLVFLGCCNAIWRLCPNLQRYGPLVLILGLAYPAFFHLIAWGQTSAPALFCFVLAYVGLHNRQEFLAGLAIGLLAFKPPLGLAAAFIFVFASQWRVVIGAVASMLAQFAAAWLYYGASVMRDYYDALRNFPRVAPFLEPRPYDMHSLRALWVLLLPWPRVISVLWVISSAIVLWAAILLWRSAAPLPIRFSALLLATVLVAPHLTVYDLVILAPVFLFLTDWILENPRHDVAGTTALLLYLAYILPLLSPVTGWTRLQFSVLVFVGLLACTWRMVREPGILPQPAALLSEQEG